MNRRSEKSIILKILIAVIVMAAAFTVLNSCGSGSGKDADKNSAAQENAASQEGQTENSAENAVSGISPETGELFYACLRETVVPKIGVCDKARFRTELENKNLEGNTGLLSALVDDLDNDGSPEMVTVSVAQLDSIEGTLSSLVFNRGECVAVNIDLYELEDGKVVHADGPCNIGVMYGVSFGSISVYAAKWDGVTYFTGFSSQDDNTTGGPSQRAVYHPENGKLVFDYVAGGAWGQGVPDADEDNRKMNTRNMDLSKTSVTTHSEEISHLKFEQRVSKSVDVEFYDYTCMSEALDKNYDAIRDRAKAFLAGIAAKGEEGKAAVEEKLKQLEEIHNSPAAKAVGSMIDHITSGSGLSLTLKTERVEKDGSFSVSYKGPDKAMLYITADAIGKVTKASVEARTYIQTDEWIAIKDAMLTAQELGLSQGTITELSGTLNTNNLQKSADGFDILVINIDNYRLSLSR